MRDAGSRVSCCVPGCRRSYRADRCGTAETIICGRCFKLADKRLQERTNTLRRRARRIDRILGRVAKLKPCAYPASRLRRGYRRSAGFLEDVFNRAEAKAWQAVVADAEIKLAMGADGAPKRRRAA